MLPKKQPKSVKPMFITDLGELNKYRNSSFQKLTEEEYGKKNLQDTLETMDKNRDIIAQLNIPKKQREFKNGKKGMDELIKIVAGLKQDIKQIRDAQSVDSAKEWIEDNRYNGIIEALETDVDGDQVNEVVVRTADGKRPVIVNGYTTAASIFPYRNLYYNVYQTKDDRSKARAAGIRTPRDFLNTKFDVKYDEYGRKMTSYNKAFVKDFKKQLQI